MGYKICHSNGITEWADTYAEAVDMVRVVYTHAEIGHAGDITEGGGRTLCWASEDLAQNDDGSRACATIREVE